MTYERDRNYGCRLITDGTLKGLRTVVLENQRLRITVLVDRGTDVYEFLYKPTDTDFMWRSPMPLHAPKNFIPTSSSSMGSFYDHYEGAWQDILPSFGFPSSYKGAEFGLHGESSLLPWDFRVVEDKPDRVSVDFWVRLYRSPFYVEKNLTLEADSSVLKISEFIENEAKEPMALSWGHHPTLGGPFLDENCTIDISYRKAHTNVERSFERQRLEPNMVFDWPMAKSVSGQVVDMSKVPPRESQTADVLYFTEPDGAWYAVTNQNLQLGFGMVWDVKTFPYLWLWQVCHGSYDYPWYGRTYNMALELVTSPPGQGIASAVSDGTAIMIAPGERVSSHLNAVVYTGCGRVLTLHENGSVDWKKREDYE
jgi:hypothetical protein